MRASDALAFQPRPRRSAPSYYLPPASQTGERPSPTVLIGTSVRGNLQRLHSSDGLGADVDVGPNHHGPVCRSRCCDASVSGAR